MTQKKIALADYVLKAIATRNLTQSEIAERARKKGFAISQNYISKIISGSARNISVEKLKALAAGLNVPEEEIFVIARGGTSEEKITNGYASSLLARYSQLSDADKEALGPLIRALDREIEERLLKQKR